MLNGNGERPLAAFVCEALARACRIDPGDLGAETLTLDLGLDSLTLVAVLTQVEVVYDLELAPDDVLPLLEAATVAELCERLERLRA